ncbi:MAG: T9SS C-terminal target domain-containing protein [Bacteroidetes bacterium]|nr:MAG: T9SS C-terminal target domain-containing protein [Bacteroidota bacterium]REK05026.1 MAG: T9SS C-terminal target domain-containing protein [Bacteroidota bacterium]REK36471.1 MAG: T9SS C-terminal target domain-containing protein [Bacteroidota bacterium]REK51685.1 MAG: T9SS C-terminal target domain-containing protein [Bacteroidota bacterium]
MKTFTRNLVVIAALFISAICHAQLRTSIGIGPLPADNEPVCPVQIFGGGFNTSGYQETDTVPDFTLYDLNGDSMNLSSTLNSGKPILLIAGSYTCPVFRNKIASINNVVNTYDTLISVFVVYTLEAHPDVDISVYSGNVNPTSGNIAAGILYRQPTTYGERKLIAQDLLDSMAINARVLIDGPCNNWWLNYGPAPNNAYLIRPDGVVFAKHGWYDKSPENILCDLDSLLGLNGNCNTSTGGNGTFTYRMLTSNQMTGPQGSTITISGELQNNGGSDIEIIMQRLINDIPSGWSTSLCADVCYQTFEDSVHFILPDGYLQPFHFYFFTSMGLDTGMARVRLMNARNNSNSYTFNVFGRTNGQITSVDESQMQEELFSLYPNPARGFVQIFAKGNSGEKLNLDLLDAQGKIALSHSGILPNSILRIDISDLSPGIYFARLGETVSRLIVR